jgi:hypothetical protein
LFWQITATGRKAFRGGLTFSIRMKLYVAVLMLLGAVAVPCAARAQVNDQFSWGVNAGAVIPANYLAKDYNTGVNTGLTFAFGGVGQLLGVRIDGMYNWFGAKSDTAGNARILGGTVNLVMSVFGASNRLYVTGGVGGYGIRTGVKGAGTNDFGLNGGLGLWLPSVNGFIEARYHHFYRALANKKPAVFVPITVGVLF